MYRPNQKIVSATRLSISFYPFTYRIFLMGQSLLTAKIYAGLPMIKR